MTKHPHSQQVNQIQHPTSQRLKLVAKTLYGLEPMLALELKKLGVSDIQEQNRAVTFSGSLQDLYKCSYELRTAIRILLPLFEFKAQQADELYACVRQYPWHELIHPSQTFAIDATVHSKYFKHSGFAALKVKDAIVDQIRDKKGSRPSIDTRNPDLSIHLHLMDGKGRILLDSSGAPLHKRGYRLDEPQAPINEVLAAGLVMLSGWDQQQPLYDLTCGSGTLLIEAAMMAAGIPVQQSRQDFGFFRWPGFQAADWRRLREASEVKAVPQPGKFHGIDQAGSAISKARSNCRRAGVPWIGWRIGDFESLAPQEPEGVVICNPPYGERLKEADIELLYERIGNHLKQRFAGHLAWIISSNFKALKHVGLRPSQKIKVFNGKLECRFQSYSLYSGSEA